MWVLLGVDYKFCSFLGAVLVPHGVACGRCWNFYDRFCSFVVPVSVPCGIGMTLFASDKTMFLGQIELVYKGVSCLCLHPWIRGNGSGALE
jgi:hypothetical protein